MRYLNRKRFFRIIPMMVLSLNLLNIGCGTSKKMIMKERDLLAKEKENISQENKVLKNKIADVEKQLIEVRDEYNNTQSALESIKNEQAQKDQELRGMKEREASLERDIKQAVQPQAEIQVKEFKRGLVITFPETILFPSGESYIKNSAKPILKSLAKKIKEYNDRLVMVEGHTDDLPIKNECLPSNWELGAQRATTIIRYLQWGEDVPPEQLCAVSFSKYQPIVSNETVEGRRLNRRVEIIILSEDLTKQFILKTDLK
ncbi:MAG: OmpA family protein [bacterium]